MNKSIQRIRSVTLRRIKWKTIDYSRYMSHKSGSPDARYGKCAYGLYTGKEKAIARDDGRA